MLCAPRSAPRAASTASAAQSTSLRACSQETKNHSVKPVFFDALSISAATRGEIEAAAFDEHAQRDSRSKFTAKKFLKKCAKEIAVNVECHAARALAREHRGGRHRWRASAARMFARLSRAIFSQPGE
jgi:hypothetical protein